MKTKIFKVYRSLTAILVACVLAVNLHTFIFVSIPTLELHSPTSDGTHNYTDDGLLVVNPHAPHPIFELIEQAEQAWTNKLHRASKTLVEAVAEYERRYHRPPPLHFEKWWDYVVENDVQLPDEYDEIYHDLEPFWGIDPLDLQKSIEEVEAQPQIVLVMKTDQSSSIEIIDRHSDLTRHLIQRISQIILLLQDVEQFLPPFRAIFSPHDGPNFLSDHGIKSTALAAAANRSTLKHSELPEVMHSGWLSACPPSSPAWQYPFDDPPERTSHKTFISDHRLSMDPCLNPFLFRSHGQFLSHKNGPLPQSTLLPRFSLCSTLIHHDIRPSVHYGWVEDIIPRSDDPPWEEKVDERLVWRGTNTGIFHDVDTWWPNAHRDHLVNYVNNMEGTVDVLRSPLNDSERVGEPKPLRKAYVNPALLDIHFSGNVGSCSPALCDHLHEKFEWRKMQTIKETGSYKYVFDIDGNGWSGRFKRLLTSNSLVFKATIYPEWFMDRIAPWVHYVPVQIDLSDLYDTLTFFRGGLDGEGAHEDLARKIATAGREWSKKFWREEDMTAYMFRLFLEYARVTSLDRDAMTYKEDLT